MKSQLPSPGFTDVLAQMYEATKLLLRLKHKQLLKMERHKVHKSLVVMLPSHRLLLQGQHPQFYK